MAPVTLFFGTFVDLARSRSGRKHELSINHGVLWVSASTGRIQGFDWSVHSEEELRLLVRKNGWVNVQIVRSREDQNEFFFPGFIDTHIHASQYPNSGLFGSSTLLDWLESYTFPLESSMSSLSKARAAYDTVISRTLANGTTCASYFATIHVPATNLLATLCHARGQRALIGRVCMDNPSFCPEYYRDESAQSSISATEETISHIHTLDPESKLVKPIVTPRFAPTCSSTALASLGALAASHTPPLHIQTHISENTSECALVHSLFPKYPSYAAVYDAHSLLTPRTILAHAVHLTREEKELVASRKAKISHCPASNSALGSGIAQVRDLIDKGVTVGLGTDVSGGYSPSILEAVRQACLVSRLLRHTNSNVSEGAGGEEDEGREILSVEEALYLATRGGAAVVDMDGELGGFEVGMFWDVQMIRLGPATASAGTAAAAASTAGSGSETQSVVDIFGWESWTERVHKWVWSGKEAPKEVEEAFHAEYTHDDVFGEITEEGPNYRNVGFVGTVILMMKTQIGMGVLAIPSALNVLGMVPGIICLLAMACITTWSAYIIGTFKLNHREVYSIDDAGAIMFGLPGRIVLSTGFCLYFIFNSGSAILSLSIGLNAVSTHATCTAVYVAIAAIVGFAFSSVRTLGKITWLAWVGLPCILVAVIMVTIAVGVQDRPDAAPKTDEPWVSDWKVAGNPSFAEAIAAVSNLLYAFSGTPGFFSIVSEMRDPNQYPGAMAICQAGVTVVYSVIGCVVYYYCGSYVSSPALSSAGPLIKIISYAFALPGLLVTMTIVSHIPAKFIFVHILRGSRHLNSNSLVHWGTWLGCTFGIIIIAWIIASTIPVFDSLVSLIGALLGPVMCLQPFGCMWLYDNWSKGKDKKTARWGFMVFWSVMIVVVGSFLMVAGTYGSVKGIIDVYNQSGGSAAFSCEDNSGSV